MVEVLGQGCILVFCVGVFNLNVWLCGVDFFAFLMLCCSYLFLTAGVLNSGSLPSCLLVAGWLLIDCLLNLGSVAQLVVGLLQVCGWLLARS